MRIAKWMLALMALLACGLIAVGCGDDDDDSSSSDETATEESSSSGDSSSSGVDADAFLSECEDAFAGTPGEDAAATACQQAADALEQCGQQAEAAGGDDSAVEAAVQICQDAADEAVKQLEAANP
jgi:hypothetical protein